MTDAAPSNPWDELAYDYDDREGELNADLIQQTVTALPEPEVDGPILVAGVGTGLELPLLVERYPTRTFLASDVSPAMIKRLELRLHNDAGLENVRAECCDVLELPRDTAAMTLSILMIHTLRDPVAGMLAQYGSLLPGGMTAALYFPPVPEGDGPLAAMYQAARKLHPKTDPTWETELMQDLQTAGAEILFTQTLRSTWSFETPKDFSEFMERLPNNQAVIRKRGRDFFDQLWHVWSTNPGLALREGRWTGEVRARLVLARKP